MSLIHPTAVIEDGAIIGDNVTVGPFAYIGKKVRIGDNTTIASHAVIEGDTTIGKNNRIFPHAAVGTIPQDLKYDGEESLVKIGDNNIIREFVTINRGTKANNETVIGNNCLLMAYVHVAHDCIIGNNVILANACNLAGHIEVHDWAILGGLSAVHQFVHIGAHTMVSGGSMVRKDIPPFSKAGREPVSFVGVNSIGLRRRGFSNERINAIQDIYRILYLKGRNITQAVRYIEANVPATPDRDEILSFINNSQRGIMKGYVSIKDRV